MPRTTDDHRSCQQYSPMHPHSPVTIATKNTISLCEKYSLPYIYVCVHTNTHKLITINNRSCDLTRTICICCRSTARCSGVCWWALTGSRLAPCIGQLIQLCSALFRDQHTAFSSSCTTSTWLLRAAR